MKATVSYCLCRIICTEQCVAKSIYFNQMLVVYCEKRRIFDSILQYIVLSISRGRAIRGRCVLYLVNTYIVWVNMFLVRLNQEIEPRYYRFRLWPNVCLSGLFYDVSYLLKYIEIWINRFDVSMAEVFWLFMLHDDRGVGWLQCI